MTRRPVSAIAATLLLTSCGYWPQQQAVIAPQPAAFQPVPYVPEPMPAPDITHNGMVNFVPAPRPAPRPIPNFTWPDPQPLPPETDDSCVGWWRICHFY
jgi:hypothetical protein